MHMLTRSKYLTWGYNQQGIQEYNCFIAAEEGYGQS